MSNILRSRRVVARGRGMQSTVQSPGWAENEDFSDSSDECRPGAGVGRVSFRDVERDRYQLGPSIGNQRYLDDFQFHEHAHSLLTKKTNHFRLVFIFWVI